MNHLRTTAALVAALSSGALADDREGALDETSPTWDRRSATNAFITGGCSAAAPQSANDGVPYAVFAFTPIAAGVSLDVRAVSNEPGPMDLDPHLSVYCTSFDPESPLTNLLSIDDDSLGFPNALATLPGTSTLDFGTTYYAVVSSYSNWEPSRYGAFKIELGPGLEFAAVCEADLNGDSVLDFFDLSLFLTAFGESNASADLNEDGAFDFFDLSIYLNLFNTGCP